MRSKPLKRIPACLPVGMAFAGMTVCIFSTSLCLAGVYFESEIHSSLEPEIRVSKTYVSGTKMKTLMDDRYGWIIDLEKRKIIDFDLRDKFYYEFPIQEMAAQLNSAAQNQKQEGQLPVFKATQKKKKWLDYDCSLVEVKNHGKDREELWVTDQIPYTQEVVNFWRAFNRFQAASLDQFPPLKQHFEIMSRINGFILARKTRIFSFSDKPYEEVENVRRVEERMIPGDIFELPSDIRRAN